MALAFTGLAAVTPVATFYYGNPNATISVTNGDLLIVTAIGWDISGDNSTFGIGDPTLGSSWGTITGLGIDTGSFQYYDKYLRAWTIAVTSTNSSAYIEVAGGSDGSFGGVVGFNVVKVTGQATSPIGAKLSGTNAGNFTTSTLTTTTANSYVYAASGYATSLSSSDLTTYGTSSSLFAGWKSAASAGSYTGNINGNDYQSYIFIEVKVASSSTAHTATASSTITDTGTGTMSNARVGAGSGSETATGTAAASNQRALAGSATATASGTAAITVTQAISASATATASGTAAMSITQAMSASATVTATGTATASITPIITIAASATVTAVGVGAMGRTQTLAGSGTATATATAGLIAITPITGSATATASATAVALITTPGTLYGNAQKVAGLYGSSTKPTLTTRS